MNDNSAQFIPATLFKRLLAIIYDLLLLTAIIFTAGIIIAGITTFVINDGRAITEQHPFYFYYQLYLLICLVFVSFIFYGWFWTHGGQTLGMKTWKLRLTTADGESVSWQRAAIRFLVAILSWACLGSGFLWSLFDRDKRSWHDIVSKTILVQI
ncbi:MAG: RDD family protein [Gammaproteobacteria bacterium]|nr:RDD family protein [Gammaproteobacteria bacterium]